MIQESSGYGLFFDGFKKSKKSGIFAVGSIVVLIDNGGYAADTLAFAQGKKEIGAGMLEKRVSGLIQQHLHLRDQGRNPAGIIAIDPPWKTDKPPEFTSGLYREYFNLMQWTGSAGAVLPHIYNGTD
jgi:hypothetical protein